MKRIFCVILAFLYLVSARPWLGRYTAAFWGSFDTMIVITGYSSSQRQFDVAFTAAVSSFSELGKYYDRFLQYDELVNIAYINKNGYGTAIKTDDRLYRLLKYGKAGVKRTNGLVNPMFGAVTSLWQREIAKNSGAMPPKIDMLKAKSEHTSSNLLLLNEKNRSVMLLSDKAVIDVGAFAKGYAIDEVSRTLSEAGISRAAISAGGNIKVLEPPDGKTGWEIGVQNPDDTIFNGKSLERVVVNNCAIATSGDYQRFFQYEGKRYHHLIDPVTLYPAEHFRSVSVICKSAADADLFSSALFLTDLKCGSKIARQNDLAVLWIDNDGKAIANQKLNYLKNAK